MNHAKTYQITLDALFLALLIVGAQISIKIGLTTFTLQLLMVYIFAIVLDFKNALLVLTSYIILGLAGVPVFASWGGGPNYIVSPTFGFVYGFYIVILLISVAKKTKFKYKFQQIVSYALFSILGLVCLYLIGYIHGYIIINILNKKGYGLYELFTLFIVPYIPFDLIKIGVAITLCDRIKNIAEHFEKDKYFDSIDSTSTYLKRNYANLKNMTFVRADYQENGHGRMNRKWENPAGENLMFSFLIKDKNLIKEFKSISLASAVSVFKVLNKLKLQNVSIKWPNDVYVNDKKICGILLESISENDSIECLVVGIGINLNTLNFSAENENKATSYIKETGEKISINKVKKKVYKSIKKTLKEIKVGKKDYLVLANEYNYLKNKTCYGEYLGKKVLVTIFKINDDNSLQVLINNEIKNLFTGEITFHLAN